MDAAASWQRVESSMGLIAAIISQLDPEDLVRASAVSRLWRDAATDEQLWQHTCTAIPLLAQLKAEAWCELSWRELFAQQEIDARGVRTFFGAVLQLKPSQIRKLVGEMIDKRDGYWTSSSARKAYRVTIKFCNDVLARMTATADAPSTDERDCVQQNNIRKACKCTRRHCNDTPFLRSLAVGSRNGSGGLGTFGVDGSGTPGRAYPSLSSVLARPVTCVCDVHV
jgi:hypothetical protein